MSGIFDPILRFFRGLGPSQFETFRPREETGLPALPAAAPLPGLPAPRGGALVPRREELPIPAPPRGAAMFARFAPPEIPPEAPPEPAPAPQRSLFEVMFQPSEAVEPTAPEAPLAQTFRMFEPESEAAAAAPPRWFGVPFRLPTIIPSMAEGEGWNPPTAAELAERFRSIFDLPAVFDHVRGVRATPQFWWALQSHWREGLPALVKILPVIERDLFIDSSLLFGIPQEVFESFYRGAQSLEDARAAEERVKAELLQPLIYTLTDAFETLKPDDLAAGFFTLYPDEQGAYWLYYVEPYIPAPAPPGLTWERRS